MCFYSGFWGLVGFFEFLLVDFDRIVYGDYYVDIFNDLLIKQSELMKGFIYFFVYYYKFYIKLYTCQYIINLLLFALNYLYANFKYILIKIEYEKI